MNKQPVYYMQTDSRWKNKPYRVTGETSTIGGSGCGPTCAAMLIETLTGKKFTPFDACNWSMEHGYKALNQGTYYSYFAPQFKAHGIDCEQLSWSNCYGKPTHEVHTRAFKLLKQGYYLIACMGKGLWTSSGHFVLVWWEDGKVRINDPASKKDARINGNLSTFKSQVKYYWAVDAREYNQNGKAVAEPMKEENTVEVTVPILKKGSSGASVTALQQLLNAKGHACGTADGSFGPKTVTALKAYQKARGLTVDGCCGQKSWTALLTK